MSSQVKVSLLCRNSIIREGLSRILGDRDFDVSHYSSTVAALQCTDRLSDNEIPSLLLIDTGNEDLDADNIAVLQKGFPSAYLVLLTDRFDFQVMLRAFRLGIRGYIVKEISCDRLVASLRLVAMGELVLPSQLAEELQSRPEFTGAPEPENTLDTASLSVRELEILSWLMMGCPNKVISRRMDISEATVKVHVKAVLRKLSVKNRTQAAIWAAHHGMRGRCYDMEPEVISALPHPAQLPAPEIRNLVQA
jgi:two-component system nitrate/nitrite response regulator NarL